MAEHQETKVHEMTIRDSKNQETEQVRKDYSVDDEDQEKPLEYDEVCRKFGAKARGEIPEELQSMLLPQPEPYKLAGIDAKPSDIAEGRRLEPMIPKWFGATPMPLKARLPPPVRVLQRGKDLEPAVVNGADDRRIYNDIRYPWGSICRVITGAGAGSGVIVGPRHVLTASHVIDWNGNVGGTVEVHRSAGSVRASTFISKVWYYTKVTGTVSWWENDEDYALLITHDRIGDLFGWMGTRTYNSAWDDEPFWWNIGYPAAVGGGIRPTYQRNKELDEPWYDLGPARSMSTNADITGGNSGGPMFGFWSDGPYVVSVVSTQGPNNWCSGGSWLTNLVIHGRNQDP